MIVRHKKRPAAYTERQQLRHAELPDLYSFARPPSLAQTTTTEITDDDIGLRHDPVAQHRAEDFIRAALAYKMKRPDRAQARRRSIAPVAIRIALAADEDEAVHNLPDVIETMTPERVRFDG